MNTYISKDYRNNWKAESSTNLNDVLVFSVTTSKNSNGYLVTSASVGRKDGAFISHTVFQDFHQGIFMNHYPRITAKVVEKQHHEAIDKIQSVMMAAKKHYGLAA